MLIEYEVVLVEARPTMQMLVHRLLLGPLSLQSLQVAQVQDYPRHTLLRRLAMPVLSLLCLRCLQAR